MGRRSYPPLTPGEVIDILSALGFAFKNQTGSHAHYERPPTTIDPTRRVVTVDKAEQDFGSVLMQSMVRQSGVGRKAFYGATAHTAKKIR